MKMPGLFVNSLRKFTAGKRLRGPEEAAVMKLLETPPLPVK